MIDNSFIRRSIFWRELEYVLEYNKDKITEMERDNIKNAIFESPLDPSLQRLLKKDISDPTLLREQLKAVVGNEDVVDAVASLFIVQDDLRLPQVIKDLYLRKENIAIFAGAGISRLGGFPSWSQLADQAIDYLHETGIINHFECERIKGQSDNPKQKFAIFNELVPTKERRKFYLGILGPNKSKYKHGNPYESLVKFDGLKITTNMDDEFWEALRYWKVSEGRSGEAKILEGDGYDSSKPLGLTDVPEPVYADFGSLMSLNPNTIYQIHGSIRDPDTIIATTTDYLDAYHKEKGLNDFLSQVFREYTVIFTGYGLEEFELLTHCIQDRGKRHYSLTPTFFNEANLSRMMGRYFGTLNIESIPYYLDFSGYHRLCQVLQAWQRDLKQLGYYEEIRTMDEVVN